MRAKDLERVARRSIALALMLMVAPVSADTSIQPPPQPTPMQANAAAKRLWKAVRARDRQRVAAAVGARVHMWAALAGLAVDDNYETDVSRESFAARMTTLELGNEEAADWHALKEPPFAKRADTVWIGASVQASSGSEGHGARTGELAFGVRIVDDRAQVVAFDIKYGESLRIFSR